MWGKVLQSGSFLYDGIIDKVHVRRDFPDNKQYSYTKFKNEHAELLRIMK